MYQIVDIDVANRRLYPRKNGSDVSDSRQFFLIAWAFL